MPIDPSKVGLEGKPVERSWSFQDCLLYALGVGAGLDELEFSTNKNQKVLPTFAHIVGGGGVPLSEIGRFNPVMLLDGELRVELAGAIPVDGKVRSQGRILGIYDKGSGAVVVTESTSVDASTGEPRFSVRSSIFLRGEGGFGGDRGPSGARNEPPERKPDHEITYQPRPDQALLYRLTGDLNPLHSDPDFARLAGFERPILHGRCTYGFTGRALLHALCGSDPARFKVMDARFSRPVLPGEALTVQMWVTSPGEAVFRTLNSRGEVAIAQGLCNFEA
jgi:acyl dehydratase